MMRRDVGLPFRRVRHLAIGFLFLVMIVVGKHEFTSSAPDNLAMHMSSDDLASSVQAGSLQRQIALLVLFAGAIVVFTTTRGNGSYSSALRSNPALACFVGLAFLSVSWSRDPALTFRRTSEYFILCIAAMAAGRVLGPRGVIWLGYLGSAGYLLIGVCAEMALHTFQPFNIDYRFYGTLYPNEQAWNCVLLLICGSALFYEIRGLWRVMYVVTIILGGVCLLLTKSRTSLVCGVAALVFFWCSRWSQKRYQVLIIAGTLAGAIWGSIALMNPGVKSHLGQMLLAGRDADTYENFSGRIPLWQLCLEYIGKRPVVGYGFDSFWTPDHIKTISAHEGWAVPASHNGFLELLLGLGALGLALYLLHLIGTWRMLKTNNRKARCLITRCYLALFYFYLMCMFTETIAFDVGLPTFCLLCLFWSRRWWFAEVSRRRSIFTASHLTEPLAAAYRTPSAVFDPGPLHLK